jgi:hypothetical protein
MLDNLTPALSKLALPSIIAIGDLRKSNMMALPHSTALKAFSSSLKMARLTSEIGGARGHESSLLDGVLERLMSWGHEGS